MQSENGCITVFLAFTLANGNVTKVFIEVHFLLCLRHTATLKEVAKSWLEQI